jgi:opacity protein-like surface antigen
MSIRLRLSATALALSVAPAVAADLPIYVPDEPAVVIAHAASSWYLRGDIGYTFKAESSGHYLGWDAAAYPHLQSYPYERLEYEWGHDVSVGVGYQHNKYLRVEGTLGHWSRDVVGYATSSAPCRTGFGAASCRFDDSSDLTAWELMANAYVDVGTWYGITPYLGGGLGYAWLKYGDLTNVATCVSAGGTDIAGCGYTGYHDGKSSGRFVWALMAGASYDVTEKVKLDLGYRYAHYEGGEAWGWDQFDKAAGATGTQSWDKGFGFHQIRAGMRVSIW